MAIETRTMQLSLGRVRASRRLTGRRYGLPATPPAWGYLRQRRGRCAWSATRRDQDLPNVGGPVCRAGSSPGCPHHCDDARSDGVRQLRPRLDYSRQVGIVLQRIHQAGRQACLLVFACACRFITYNGRVAASQAGPAKALRHSGPAYGNQVAPSHAIHLRPTSGSAPSRGGSSNCGRRILAEASSSYRSSAASLPRHACAEHADASHWCLDTGRVTVPIKAESPGSQHRTPHSITHSGDRTSQVLPPVSHTQDKTRGLTDDRRATFRTVAGQRIFDTKRRKITGKNCSTCRTRPLMVSSKSRLQPTSVGRGATHNPEVAGSSPAPAIRTWR